MIKTLKKFSKKSLAILIALLMIISVMPFTPPISVEAADGYEVLGKVTIDPIIYTHGTYSGTTESEYAYMNYGSTIADGSYDGECKTAVSVPSTLTISSVEAVGVSGASLRVENGLLKGKLGSAYEGSGNADKTVTLKFNFSDGTYEYHKMPVKTNPVAQHVAGFSQRQNSPNTYKRGISFEMLAVGSYGQTNEGSYSATKQANNTSATRNFKKMYAPFNTNGSVGAYCAKDKFYGFTDSYIETDKQCGYAVRNRKQEVGTDITLTVNSKKGYYYLDKSADTNYGIIKENNKYYVDVLVGKIYNDFDDDSISYNNRSVSGVSESKIIDISNITSITETKQAKGTDQRGYIRCEITNPSAGSTIEANTSIKYQSDHNVYAALVLNLPFDIQITDKSNTRNLYKDYIKNLDPRCYTAETWETFRNALLTAEEFLNDNTDNSSDATAKSNLENAKKKLVVNSDNSSVHKHYKEGVVTTQPTCTTAGVTTHTCACGYSYTTNEPAATGHTEVTDEAVAPTCTETGLTQGKHCSVCNTVLVAQTEIPATGHKEGTPVEENRVNATCTVNGSYDSVVYCTVCNAELSREQKTITAPGHNYTSVVTAPTCTEQGYTTHTCSCGDTYKDTYTNALGHSFTNYVSNNNATCTTDGTKTAKCDRCDLTDTITDTGSATDHNYTSEVTKAATCSEQGIRTYTCQNDGTHTYTEYIAIDPNAHNYGDWVDDKNGSTHTRVCSYNEEHKDTKAHNMNGNTCDDCGYVSKVTITFLNVDDTQISSIEYNVGAEITVPKLDTKYDYNNDDATHTVTTYGWDKEVNTTAVETITYKAVALTESVSCSFERTGVDIPDGDITKDKFTCSKCGGVMYKKVADMSALNANIKALETAINVDDASYKYEAGTLENAKIILNAAKTYAADDNNRYASIDDVNSKATLVGSTYTVLTTTGLAKYSQTFIIRKDDGQGNTKDIATFTEGYENLAYGSTVEFDKYVIPTIEDENSTLNGLPMYAVYKWVKVINGAEQKLGTTDIQISDVVKGNATYICYVLDFKATDETQTKTRVRYLDKSGNTIEFDFATVDTKYEIKKSVKAPLIPYYVFDKWECKFGTPDNVGTREIVYQATYTYSDTKANVCEIVGKGDVRVNGKQSCEAIYDSKVILTGATKYAFCDENENIISYINEDYIYTPRIKETVYIKAVTEEVTKATTAITGRFTQLNTGTTTGGTQINTLFVNAQYYLPEGATAVEAGVVIGKENNADALKIGSATKVVSNSQGTNHEYSIGMTYTKAGTLYTRSYLIYKINGETKTAYSDIVECVLNIG